MLAVCQNGGTPNASEESGPSSGRLAHSESSPDGSEESSPQGLAKAPSPAGCVGTTDNPHPSTTTGYLNTINVKGRTSCKYSVPSLYVEVRLQRDRWWGWETIETSPKQRSSVSSILHNAADYCQTTSYVYRGRTYHVSNEISGPYYLTTYSPRNFAIRLSGSKCIYA